MLTLDRLLLPTKEAVVFLAYSYLPLTLIAHAHDTHDTHDTHAHHRTRHDARTHRLMRGHTDHAVVWANAS
jgi:hypothetical protein